MALNSLFTLSIENVYQRFFRYENDLKGTIHPIILDCKEEQEKLIIINEATFNKLLNFCRYLFSGSNIS